MHPTVGPSVGPLGETHFAYRAELPDERGNVVGSPFAVGYQIEHRILGWPIPRGRFLGVRHHEPARPAERRLVVAHGALIRVEARAETRGVSQGDEVCFSRIDKRANDRVSAVIAHGLELDGALHTLVEHLQLYRSEAVQRLAGSRRTATHAWIA